MAEKNQNNEIIFYTTPTGNVKIEVVFNNETFWLTQKTMAELFGVKVPVIPNKKKAEICISAL